MPRKSTSDCQPHGSLAAARSANASATEAKAEPSRLGPCLALQAFRCSFQPGLLAALRLLEAACWPVALNFHVSKTARHKADSKDVQFECYLPDKRCRKRAGSSFFSQGDQGDRVRWHAPGQA